MYLAMMFVNIYEFLASAVITHKGLLAFRAQCEMFIASVAIILRVLLYGLEVLATCITFYI